MTPGMGQRGGNGNGKWKESRCERARLRGLTALPCSPLVRGCPPGAWGEPPAMHTSLQAKSRQTQAVWEVGSVKVNVSPPHGGRKQ